MNKKKRVMVVCKNNFVRSRFVARVLLDKGFLKVKSSGLGVLAYILGVHFDFERDKSYDLYLAADFFVYNELKNYGLKKEKIVNLGIKNIYWRFIPFNFLSFRTLKELENKIPLILKKKKIL